MTETEEEFKAKAAIGALTASSSMLEQYHKSSINIAHWAYDIADKMWNEHCSRFETPIEVDLTTGNFKLEARRIARNDDFTTNQIYEITTTYNSPNILVVPSAGGRGQTISYPTQTALELEWRILKIL